MSDSNESGFTYTDISSPFEELSDIGSPRANDHEHFELPEMLEDSYVEEEEEEEHPAPVDSVVVASTAADQVPSAEETKPFETDESVATPPPYPAYRMTARISIPALVPMPAWTDSEVVRLLAISSPPASPLSPWSSPPPQIPFPPLPPILSPHSPVLSPAPPPSLICSLGYRATIIRLRDEAASTSSPPLQLPFASHKEDRPEVTLPPQKRLGIALGPRYEVGESSSVAAARPAGGLRADYGFVATMDREIMRDPEREVGYGITDSWDEIVGLYREHQDRRAHAYTHHLMETKARMSREAWVRSTDASDLVCGEVMSLRTTVLGQMSEIRELQATDRRRQTVISELLRTDHRRSTEITELRIALQGQVTALQGQVNDVIRLQALVDKKKVVVTEATIREVLLLDDAEGVECLPNEDIFAELARMGYEKPSTKLTFYKAFFLSQWKFLIHTIL
nr:hypothetical protein [Tanacetum cinerariifolium]